MNYSYFMSIRGSGWPLPLVRNINLYIFIYIYKGGGFKWGRENKSNKTFHKENGRKK
jgi:hypothetical protein